jgi:uncharacterized RDD family membrane protein YckC
MKDFFNSIYKEIWGETVTYPVVNRLLAFIIDFIIVYLINIIPFVAYYVDSEMETYQTMMLNVVTGLFYFSILNSRHGNGQTFGKRLFKIRVVNKNGKTINFWTSFARSLPIVWITNWLLISLTLHLNDLPYNYIVHGLIIFAFGTLYFVAILPSRQGLHDIIVGTQVTSTKLQVQTTKGLTIMRFLGFIIPVTVYIVYLIIR